MQNPKLELPKIQNKELDLAKIQWGLDLIDPDRKIWYFEVIPSKYHQAIPRTYHFKRTVQEAESFLMRHNTQDKGIYYMVNEWDPEGSETPTNKDIVRARHLFIDVDSKHKIPEEFHEERPAGR